MYVVVTGYIDYRVSPMIPMLPLKLIDFVESPVPILAGLPLDGSSGGKGLDVPSLLGRCRCVGISHGLSIMILW